MLKRNRIAIQATDVSKCYRIGAKGQGYRTFREALVDSVSNPFLKLRGSSRHAPEAELFWALKGVSFEIGPGEVVGIIGRNGAGKSTLLKILARITDPTSGRIELCGRVASLLEVGTGFHPELTGRENIFLNGAILGMRRGEILRHFDAIVDFAEIDQFIDTPVKRYSSGMYVRLAFAVAAHLEPEILVVDEVLAVGDARFQQKCLGKMDEVARRKGRTVLLVSHNLAAVKSLATSAIVLDRGRLEMNGGVDDAINVYAKIQDRNADPGTTKDWGKGVHTRIMAAEMMGADGPTRSYVPGAPMRLEIRLEKESVDGLSLEVQLSDAIRSKLGLWSLHHFESVMLPGAHGTYVVQLKLAPLWLASGRYFLDVLTSIPGVGWDHAVSEAIEFDVPFSNPGGKSWDFKQSYGYGVIALPLAVPPVVERV
jgi:lipopolysaccharide transport system ATP-binding protein